MNLRLLFLLVLLCLNVELIGQEKAQTSDEEKEPPAVAGSIRFQRIKTNGTDIFMVRMVANKEKKPIKKKRTVLVPVFTDKGLEKRPEVKIYHVPAMDEKLVPVPENYAFIDIRGRTISRKEMLGHLGMGKGKLLIMLFANQEIPEAYKELLSKDTIFVQPRPKLKSAPEKKPAAKK